MATWREFAHASPEIAEAGKRLMHQFGVAQASWLPSARTAVHVCTPSARSLPTPGFTSS